jgi:hypothetical protein
VGRVGRLVGVDGTQKMSKSLGNAIYLTDTTAQIDGYRLARPFRVVLLRAAALVGLVPLLACGRSELTPPAGPTGASATAADAGGETPDAESATDVPAPPDDTDDGPPSFFEAPETSLIEASFIDVAIPVATCGPDVCHGCCQPDGICVTSDTTTACGFGGEPCSTCAASEFCRGTCLRYQSNCGLSNCPGCCEGFDICATGLNDVECGQNGQQCQRCVPSEGTGRCVPQARGGGLCNAIVSCNPANCGGCCEGNVCVIGVNQDHCGNNGAPCGTCPAGTECVSAARGTGGGCANVGSCDPSNCVGCCSGNVCAYGNQDVACGAGGAVCSDCTSRGAKCVSGNCE